ELRARHQHERQLADERDRREGAVGVVGQPGVERRVDRLRADVGDQQGVAVRPGLGHHVDADHPAGAAAVLDHHRRALPELRQLGGHRARGDVGAPSRCERDDKSDRAGGVGLGERAARQQDESQRCEMLERDHARIIAQRATIPFLEKPRMSRPLFALVLALSTSLAFAQAQKAPAPAYEPSVGQEGKDVVWVPTPQVVVNKMLDMAKVTKDDFVMDLGSGDGRTVITAAKRGARALGVEYNPDMVELSKRNAEKAGVSGRAQFVKADLFETDFSKATVVTMFLLPDINLRLRPKLLEMKP